MDRPAYLFDKSLIFSQTPLFAGLNFFERKLVFDSLEIGEFKKSQVVYHQGSPADAFYCIISGRVGIFIEKEGREELLEYIHRGKYFGFISLLTGEPHSVCARAVNDTVVAKISKEDFNAILKRIPRLAIELSRMLSRRLKRKDFHPKSIFESTIIATFSDETIGFESSCYALNLALGLRRETQKKVVLVDVDIPDSAICESLGIDRSLGFFAAQPLFNTEEVFKKIIRHTSGIDVLRILSKKDIKPSVPLLISLLTMLVNDYHYCIFPLSSDFGAEAFKILAQSDLVHLIVAPDPQSLRRTSQIMEVCQVWTDPELKKKIKLIILEEPKIHGKGPKLSSEEEAALFHQPIFATLPPLEAKKPFLIKADFKDPYSKTIRRISRQVGDILVGLALGSGSAMGLAHIGILKVLEKEGIPVDIVCGSSIGALIGALWCSGYSAKEVEHIILENKDKKYFFSLDDLTLSVRGLTKGKHVYRFLKKYLNNKTFCDLKRPFRVVACDYLSMKQVVFDSGRLIDAVLASISIPGVFQPYKIRDRYYIDGGILNPLPTDVLVRYGAEKIISVNVLPSPDEIERTNELFKRQSSHVNINWPLLKKIVLLAKNKIRDILKPNIFDILVLSTQSSEYLLAQLNSLSQSDVALHPDMTAVSWAAFDEAAEIIKRGEEEARLHLSEIKELVNQPA